MRLNTAIIDKLNVRRIGVRIVVIIYMTVIRLTLIGMRVTMCISVRIRKLHPRNAGVSNVGMGIGMRDAGVSNVGMGIGM